MPETYDEGTRRLLENRRRNAELRRAEQIKKRNNLITYAIIGVIILIFIITIFNSCSSGEDEQNQQTTTKQPVTTVEQTTEQVEETTAEPVMYTTDTLNLRQSPDSSVSDNIIKTLDAGVMVTVLSEEVSNGDTWCKVIVGTEEGYVVKQYLSYQNMVN